MLERMQTLQKMQSMKLNKHHRKAGQSHNFMSLTQDFEQNVMQDQATSVFLTANARLLSKAQSLN